MFGLLGFLPGWALAKIQQAVGVLRIPREVELQGLDFVENKVSKAAQSDVINAEKAALAQK